MCSRRRVNSISLFVERATFRTSKFQNLRKTKNIVVAKKKRYSKKCQKSICYFQLDNPSANNMKNKRIERYKNDNFVHHRFSLKILIGKTWESDYHKNCDGQLRDAKKIPDNLTLNRRRDVWRINSTLIQKKEKKNTRYPSAAEYSTFFQTKFCGNTRQGGALKKRGSGVTKQKTTRTEAYSCERGGRIRINFGKGERMSPRGAIAHRLFARGRRKGDGEKKKSYRFISVPPILSHLFRNTSTERTLTRIEDDAIDRFH